jgi:acyl carrier protein
MGLDGVELVMTIEDKFNIKISDQEACQSDTVGKLYQCVLDKIGVSSGNRCSSQQAFYRLRKALKESLCVEEIVIKPKTNTELIFPENERKMLWSRMSTNVSYKFPELEYPAIIIIFILIFSLLSGGICSYSLFLYLHGFVCFIPALVWIPVTAMLYKLMYKNLQGFKIIIPCGDETLGGLAKHVLYTNSLYFATLSKEEIWEKLTSIISEQLGIRREDIKPESNFVKDFNI